MQYPEARKKLLQFCSETKPLLVQIAKIAGQAMELPGSDDGSGHATLHQEIRPIIRQLTAKLIEMDGSTYDAGGDSAGAAKQDPASVATREIAMVLMDVISNALSKVAVVVTSPELGGEAKANSLAEAKSMLEQIVLEMEQARLDNGDLLYRNLMHRFNFEPIEPLALHPAVAEKLVAFSSETLPETRWCILILREAEKICAGGPASAGPAALHKSFGTLTESIGARIRGVRLSTYAVRDGIEAPKSDPQSIAIRALAEMLSHRINNSLNGANCSLILLKRGAISASEIARSRRELEQLIVEMERSQSDGAQFFYKNLVHCRKFEPIEPSTGVKA